MKKIILLFIFLLCTIVSYSQPVSSVLMRRDTVSLLTTQSRFLVDSTLKADTLGAHLSYMQWLRSLGENDSTAKSNWIKKLPDGVTLKQNADSTLSVDTSSGKIATQNMLTLKDSSGYLVPILYGEGIVFSKNIEGANTSSTTGSFSLSSINTGSANTFQPLDIAGVVNNAYGDTVGSLYTLRLSARNIGSGKVNHMMALRILDYTMSDTMLNEASFGIYIGNVIGGKENTALFLQGAGSSGSLAWSNGNGSNRFQYLQPSSNFGMQFVTQLLRVYGGMTIGSSVWADSSADGVLTVGSRIFVNSTGSDGSTLSIGGTVTASGLINALGGIYMQSTALQGASSIQILNKAGSGWLTFANRNVTGAEAVYDLTNVGSISASGFISAATDSATAATGQWYQTFDHKIAVKQDFSDYWYLWLGIFIPFLYSNRKKIFKDLIILFAFILIGNLQAQTKQDSINVQQKQYNFQVELRKEQQLEQQLNAQKIKAFDAWEQWQISLQPFQKPKEYEKK